VSTAESEERPREIIIVRRGRDDEDDAHHGGVWKIAFADFMTAMMCFFLVMWLINAANEETRAAVASYFNPVRLTDRNTGPKGLEDWGKERVTSPSSGGPADEPADAPSQPHTSAAQRYDSRQVSDERLFSDPYAILAEIAADTGTNQNLSAKGDGGAQEAGPATGASGGESYRDPFAPDFWSQQVAAPLDKTEESAVEADAVTAHEAREKAASAADVDAPAEAQKQADAQQASFERIPDVEPLAEKAANLQPAEQTANAEAKAKAAEDRPLSEDVAKAEAPPDSTKSGSQPPGRREKIAEDIRGDLASAFKGEKIAASISVTVEEDGVLISVTDDMEHGMFAIGSAVPRRELVLAMEKIGRAIMGHPGNVVIRGHTDGRPFASKTYDNWRLSTARAQAAYYMLVRSGIDERRITEVAGFADRKLKVPDDPYADVNRRIEILLEVPQ